MLSGCFVSLYLLWQHRNLILLGHDGRRCVSGFLFDAAEVELRVELTVLVDDGEVPLLLDPA